MGTRRNDPLDDPAFRKMVQRRFEQGWLLDKIEPISTKDIFAKLNQLGLPVTAQQFQDTAQHVESAIAIADGWRKQHRLRSKHPNDEDFVWTAAIVLWKRLVPDRICFEQIDEQLQKGYEALKAGKTGNACDIWWQAWQWVKGKATPQRNTPHALDEVYRGMHFVFNWCQDFEMELGNAGLDNAPYHRLRVQYCLEFLTTFPAVDSEMRGNFLRAEAEAYWRLGETETADAKYAALIEAYPDWAWGYVGWADEYWMFEDSAKDYARAEAILKQALARPSLEDMQDVVDRLNDLREEQRNTQKNREKGS